MKPVTIPLNIASTMKLYASLYTYLMLCNWQHAEYRCLECMEVDLEGQIWEPLN